MKLETNLKLGRLTLIERFVGLKNDRKSYWKCLCECGKEVIIRSDALNKDKQPTRSCGCIKKEQEIINFEKRIKHNFTGTKLYNKYVGMKDRCYNKNNTRYINYGGKGIKLCSEWLKDFNNFKDWAFKNGFIEQSKETKIKDLLTIERIDINKNYSPENCIFITFKEQCKNRTNSIIINDNNEVMCLSDFLKKYNIDNKNIYNKVKKLKTKHFTKYEILSVIYSR